REPRISAFTYIVLVGVDDLRLVAQDRRDDVGKRRRFQKIVLVDKCGVSSGADIQPPVQRGGHSATGVVVDTLDARILRRERLEEGPPVQSRVTVACDD